MSLWTNVDEEAGKPKYLNTADKADTYGVDKTEAGVAGISPGWVQVTHGQGPVTEVTISDGGTGYADGTLVFTGAGDGGAAGTYTQTGGVIDSVVLTAGGLYQAGATVAPSNAGNGDAVLTLTLGGRAGRVKREVLVSMGSITGDAEDVEFPDS